MEHRKSKTKEKIQYWAGLLLILLAILYALCQLKTQQYFGVVNENALVNIPIKQLPENTLYITYERRLYQRGEMTLLIPAISVDSPIGESTEPEYLTQMPGLYEFAQLPGEGDVNTSIAGHRDIYDMVFYSLDKLQEGDYLYILHNDSIYQYEYLNTAIVKPDDWSIILPQGFSCLTLTTCDPIGTSWNRLIVRGKLVDIYEFDETYEFIANTQGLS